jgi:hypothetical protein
VKNYHRRNHKRKFYTIQFYDNVVRKWFNYLPFVDMPYSYASGAWDILTSMPFKKVKYRFLCNKQVLCRINRDTYKRVKHKSLRGVK